MTACNWANEDYFSDLMSIDSHCHTALELMVDDLHSDKEKTIYTFLCHSGSEDFLWGLVRLLGSDNPRVAGNSAYILGTLAESDLGCGRIMALAKGRHQASNILSDLTRMLTFDDQESVMNAAGTMGTLAESQEGRAWMLVSPCVQDTIQHITALLTNPNLWTASNAALVLARLCISEDGCNAILSHPKALGILSHLVQALGVDEAGRGMNAAFAIGRLCDMDSGRQRLLYLQDSEKMITSLAKMLSCEDPGASKNSCFALSCLATNLEGHNRLLQNTHSDDVLLTLAQLLNADDSETGWFAAMTLRTLASQPKGCVRLRNNTPVIQALKAIEGQSDLNADLKEEVILTLDILKPLDKPQPPTVEVKGAHSVHASWETSVTKSGLAVTYQLFEGARCVYEGEDVEFTMEGLSANTQYVFKLRAYTDGDTTGFSEPVTVTTEEGLPEAPTNLQILARTITQLKVGWEPPFVTHGAIKGYHVYHSGNCVEHTSDLTAIISGLAANTAYEIQVCASTAKGKGRKASITGTTAELGAHAPSKPHVQVIGRNEMHVSWEPPEVPLGRITRYDLSMNGKGVYSGTDLSYTALRLTPYSEYTFVVTALTNEGKFESKPTKKKTSKDEFDCSRPPLYQPPSKKEAEEEVKPAAARKVKVTSEPRLPPHSKGQNTFGSVDHSKSESCSEAVVQQSRPSLAVESESEVADSRIAPSVITSGPTQKPKPTHTAKPAPTLSRTDNRLVPTKEISLNPSSPSPPVAKETTSSHRARGERGQRPPAPTPFPVTISYVSIQGGDAAHFELESVGSDVTLKKAFSQSSVMAAPTSVRFDRSKASFLNPKPSNRPVLGRLDAVDLKSGFLPPQASESSDVFSSKQNVVPSPSSVYWAEEMPWSKASVSLPKPVAPSQAYLEGVKIGGASSSPSPYPYPHPPLGQARMTRSMDLCVSDLTLEPPRPQRSKNLPPPKQSSPSPPVICDLQVLPPHSNYFDEAQHLFLQRARTFMRSHRPATVAQSRVQSSRVPVQVIGGERPGGNQRPPHNKFVPMQYRTQPSNLSPTQLQRVSNTVLQPHNTMAGACLQSFSRSQTHSSLHHQSSPHVRRPTFRNPDKNLLTLTSQSVPPSHS